MTDQPEPNAKLIIKHRDKRFVQRHACVTKRLELAVAIEMKEELSDCFANNELDGDKL